MNKVLQIIGMAALLAIGIIKAEITQKEIDTELVKPLVDIVIKDADTKLNTLARQYDYVNAKIKSDIPNIEPIIKEKNQLSDRRKNLEKELSYYEDRFGINVYKAYQAQQIQNNLAAIDAKLRTAEDQLYPYKNQLNIKNEIEDRMQELLKRKQNPVTYLFNAFRQINISTPNDLIDKERARWLEDAEKVYYKVNQIIEQASNDEFIENRLQGRVPFAYNDHLLRRFLGNKAATLSLALKEKSPIYVQLLNEYMKNVQKSPQETENRIQKTFERSGGYFSPVEATLQMPTSYIPEWMSGAWQTTKEYAQPYIEKARQYWEQLRGTEQPIQQSKVYEYMIPRYRGPYRAFATQRLRYMSPQEFKRPTMEALRRYQQQ